MEKRNYLPDVLEGGFNQLILPLTDDYEGKVIATLIRRETEKSFAKAILYIHGFNDYFFQKDLAKRFNQHNYNFYALDLRKYGRSFLPHQKLNNVRSLSEYDEEINIALNIIHSENKNQVILMGHSTGGLIITDYAKRHPKSDTFHGIICNSPFYDFNLSTIERKIGIPILSFFAKYSPDKPIKAGLSELYGHTLHKDHYGKLNYSLVWKPHLVPKINLSFIRAIYKAQQNIKYNMIINVPMLVLHSDKSIIDNTWSEKFKFADSVLNVNHISKVAQNIKGNITVSEIKNGMHDLFLSEKEAKEDAYGEMFKWVEGSF